MTIKTKIFLILEYIYFFINNYKVHQYNIYAVKTFVYIYLFIIYIHLLSD